MTGAVALSPPLAAASGWGGALFPLAAAIVALVFGAMLARLFMSRRRPFHGLWALAMFMFAAASFAMALGVADGWTAAEYRVYWLFGAILNVPYLAVGEVYLLARRRWIAHITLGLLLVGTAFAAKTVLAAPIDSAALAKSLPLGKDVFGDSSAPYRLAQVYAYPAYFLLLGGIVWSAWGMRGRPDLRDRTAGAVGIALGATIVAVGSGVGAGLNNPPIFSLCLALGIVVMFAGFLRTARAPRPAASGSTAAGASSDRA